MKYSDNSLYFCRYTPSNQDQFAAPDFQSDIYKIKIFSIVNDQYKISTKTIFHQMSGVFEVSKKGKYHFHFCICAPISINSLRDTLKKRLDAFGNKEISCKQYDFTQESFDLSNIYMSKGSLNSDLYYNKELNYEFFEFKGLDHYVTHWVDRTPQQDVSDLEVKKRQKFQFFLSMIHKKLEKTHKKSKLKIDTKYTLDEIISWYSFEELKKLTFKTLVQDTIKQKVFGNMTALTEMSVWIALTLISQSKQNIDDELDELFMVKNKKYIIDN